MKRVEQNEKESLCQHNQQTVQKCICFHWGMLAEVCWFSRHKTR